MEARLFRVIATTALAWATVAGATPREIGPVAELRCASECTRAEKVDHALARAAAWLDGYGGTLRFDAAVLLSQVRRHVDSSALRSAFARARVRADRDHDHPHRRLWDAEATSPAAHTSEWEIPRAGAERANPNRAISEALHCRENGWRAATEAYVCGAMRDAGGYYTTHAIWALYLARTHECTRADACLAELRAELRAAQPANLPTDSTLASDLFAERLVMLLETGAPQAAEGRGIDALLQHQHPDGSWGRDGDADPYFRYHATVVAAWALAAWTSKTPVDEE